MDNVEVTKPQNDIIQTIKSSENLLVKGKIEIDVVTPELEPEKLEDPTYYAPGAFYLKSILIHYNEKLPNKTVSLVKSSEEIISGNKYLIIGLSIAGYSMLDGTLGSSVKENPYFLEIESLEFEMEVAGDFDKYGFTASFSEEEKLNFQSDKGIKVGLAGSGTLSTVKEPALTGWNYYVSENHFVHMSMYDTSDTPRLRHFSVNQDSGKFNTVANEQDTIYLYKF